MKRQVVIEIITFSLIFLFVYASANKLLDVEKFRVQIGQSPLLVDIAGFVVWFIPAVELLTAIFLAISKTRLIGLYASFGLMVMFTAYIIAILGFSEKIPCSCGGILSNMGWKEHLIFNCAFAVLALVGVVLESLHAQKPRIVVQ